jgi:AcrR family transcriptional regulator
VGRPKVPLIDRDAAIAKSLEIIDAAGLDAFSIRRLGRELGVNGASLYHHFADKDEILRGVRLLVLKESRVVPTTWSATWREHLTTSMVRYREALLRHPNAAPLMLPQAIRPTSLALGERIITNMVAEGVPLRYAYPIIDSVETLAFGSVMRNPQKRPPRDQIDLAGRKDLPNTERAGRLAPRTAKALFLLELEVLLDGWAALIEREQDDQRAAEA